MSDAMHLLSRDEAQTILRDHLPTFEAAARKGMKSWVAMQARYGGLPTDFSNRTRASHIFDVATSEIERALAGSPGARATRKDQTFYVTFGNTLRVRFKKFNGPALTVSGSSTARARLWNGQTLMDSDDVEQPTLLVAGYLVDATGIEFERLAVTCTAGGKRVWEPIDFLSTQAPADERRLPDQVPAGPIVLPAPNPAKAPAKDGTQS